MRSRLTPPSFTFYKPVLIFSNTFSGVEQAFPDNNPNELAADRYIKKHRPRSLDPYFEQLAKLWVMIVKPVVEALGLTVCLTPLTRSPYI